MGTDMTDSQLFHGTAGEAIDIQSLMIQFENEQQK